MALSNTVRATQSRRMPLFIIHAIALDTESHVGVEQMEEKILTVIKSMGWKGYQCYNKFMFIRVTLQ
jgi:hypothetical protein